MTGVKYHGGPPLTDSELTYYIRDPQNWADSGLSLNRNAQPFLEEANAATIKPNPIPPTVHPRKANGDSGKKKSPTPIPNMTPPPIAHELLSSLLLRISMFLLRLSNPLPMICDCNQSDYSGLRKPYKIAPPDRGVKNPCWVSERTALELLCIEGPADT